MVSYFLIYDPMLPAVLRSCAAVVTVFASLTPRFLYVYRALCVPPPIPAQYTISGSVIGFSLCFVLGMFWAFRSERRLRTRQDEVHGLQRVPLLSSAPVALVYPSSSGGHDGKSGLQDVAGPQLVQPMPAGQLGLKTPPRGLFTVSPAGIVVTEGIPQQPSQSQLPGVS